MSRIGQVIGLLDKRIFVGVSINGAGNLAQGIAALDGVAGNCRRIFSIRS
jgi:hypothetical protein